MTKLQLLIERYRSLLTFYGVENEIAHQRLTALLLFNTLLIYAVLLAGSGATQDKAVAVALPIMGIASNAVLALAGRRTEIAFSLWAAMIQKTESDLNGEIAASAASGSATPIAPPSESFSIERIRREHYRWSRGAPGFKNRFGPFLDLANDRVARDLERKAGLYSQWPWSWWPSVLTVYLVLLPAVAAGLWFLLLVRAFR